MTRKGNREVGSQGAGDRDSLEMSLPGPHTEILVISTGCAVGCLLLTPPQSQWHCWTHGSVWRTELHFQERKSSSIY